jgi:hypothetical protein
MTKDEIIDQMIDEMPFNLSENIRSYVKEAMEIYAQQEVKKCNVPDVMQQGELLLAFANALNEECGFPLNSEGFEEYIAEFLSKQ